jgi:hypothetical protein
MSEIIYLLSITAVLAANSLITYILARLFAEKSLLPLNFKPFNCRPCLAFWLTAVSNAAFAIYLAFNSPIYGVFATLYGVGGVGVLFAFINFLYIKSKFQIYD